MNWWNLFGLNPTFKDFTEKYPRKTLIGIAWAMNWRFALLALVIEIILFALLFVVFSSMRTESRISLGEAFIPSSPSEQGFFETDWAASTLSDAQLTSDLKTGLKGLLLSYDEEFAAKMAAYLDEFDGRGLHDSEIDGLADDLVETHSLCWGLSADECRANFDSTL